MQLSTGEATVQTSYLRNVRAMSATTATIVALFGLGGCASDDPVKPLPNFARISISANDKLAGDLNANSTSEKATLGAAGGGAAGAATGALVGLLCGPFAVICSPLFAVGGGITGGIAGGVINGRDGLPGESAKQVSEVLARLDQRRDFVAEMRTKVTAGIPATRLSSPDGADAVVVVALKGIDLQQYGHNQVALRISGSMTVVWNHGRAKPTTQRNEYQYETAQDQVNQWLLNDGQRFDQGVSECIDRIAQRMVGDLTTGTSTPSG